MPTHLETPILNEQTVAINFFNGRLLSGEDLTSEQTAHRRAHDLLGQAIGDGVVYGLEADETLGVSSVSAPVLTVRAGLAINRNGHRLLLNTDTQVALVRPPNVVAGTSLFQDCRPPQGGTYVANAGVYLLVISPVQMVQGSAPVTGLGNVPASCNSRFRADAVQFRLIQLDVPQADFGAALFLRNTTAYRCFNTARHNAILANPLGSSFAQQNLIDRLRPTSLTDCDVPLCVLGWTATGGVQFVDRWAVRRQPALRFPGMAFGAGVDLVFQAETAARFLQFQEHIETLRLRVANAQLIRARDYFRHLPPVGILPLNSATTPQGLDYLRFFQGMVTRTPAFVEGSRLETMLRESHAYDPIDVFSQELVWLYRIRQNTQGILAGGQQAPCLLFMTGHAPYYGDAHYQVNRWSFSNYL